MTPTMRSDTHAPAFIVAGMHRSGTSFLASVLERGGCRMGEVLLAADQHNRPGYFEDVEFVELNRRMFAAVLPADRPGHRDWGWIEDFDSAPGFGTWAWAIDVSRLAPSVAEADVLIARRRAQAGEVGDVGDAGACWGWKDPRSSLLLDFWDARLPEARYVFIYRSPWDVADSMQRLGADVFLRHPDYAYRIWHYYNRALLTFARAHRDRTIVVSATALMREPKQLAEIVRSRFGIALALEANDAAGIVDPELFAAVGPDDPLPSLAAAIHSECADVLRELEAIADLPSGDPPPPPLAAPTPKGNAQLAIVTPCFNHGELLIEAIASVERTVSVPYDLIVVNDGSRDPHTLEVLSCLRRAGYRIIDQENRGLAEARNRGIRESGHALFLPLDADNRLRPGFVEAALDVLARDASVMAVYGDRVEFGLRTGRVLVDVPDLDRLLCGNYIDACAVIRTEAWFACRGYDTRMPVPGAEDWDLWLSMLERDFILHRLDMAAFDYRVRPDSMLSRLEDPAAQAATERYVLAKHAPFYMQHLRRQFDRLHANAKATTRG